MKTEIYNNLKQFADESEQSVLEFIVSEKIKTVGLEKDLKLVSFDGGKTHYNLSDLECLYIDLCFQAYLDRMIG